METIRRVKWKVAIKHAEEMKNDHRLYSSD